MSPTPENDPLDALLRENEPYMDDAGFTARVMASLPPRRRLWLRPAILCGAIFLGFGLLVWFAPYLLSVLGRDAAGEIVLNLNTQSLLMVAVFLTGFASLAWGLFSVLRWED